MKDHELRFSGTNSADDSEGKTRGLDGNLFWFIVAGVFLFVVTLLLLFSALRCSFGQSFGIAIIPLALTLLYVFGFRQGKPIFNNIASKAKTSPNNSTILSSTRRSWRLRRSGSRKS